MRSKAMGIKLLAVGMGIAMIAAACSSSSSSKTGSSTGGGSTGTTTTTVPVEAAPQGGTLTIGAEQEPDCTDWIASCGGSSWGAWMALYTTLPRAFDVLKSGSGWDYKPSILLAGEPTLVTSPKQVVTYKINPKAVWSDGTPITSTDFKYLAYQVRDGSDIYDQTGYKQIETVDDSKPDTAVVTFKTPFAGWKGLFGGGYGLMPSHLLQGKDRSAMMKDGYDFSGGPYIAKWTKGDNITLTPNPKWWGSKSHLDKIVFKFVADTSAEFQAFKAGEVNMIYPQPQIDVIQQIQAGIEGAHSVYTAQTANTEAIWMNNERIPTAVRQAIAYSLDRDAIVNKLFGALGVKKATQNLEAPILGQYADDSQFAKYKPNPSKAASLLKDAGYTKGADGYYAKDGKTLSLTMMTTAGNKRRELTEQIVQDQLKTAGIKIVIDNKKAGDLFGQILPGGQYDIAVYAQVLTALEPGGNTLFDSVNIPTPANGGSGQNWTRTNMGAEADANLVKLDTELDQAKREAAGKKASADEAAAVVSLPFDPLPNIAIWQAKVVGPISDNPLYGPWWNLTEWGVKAS